MNYYKERREAIMKIDKMLSEGVPTIVIKHKIILEYGYSGKIVDDRIKHFEEMRLSQP